MTDRYHSLVVVLDENTRNDDAQALISAIRQLRGVISVKGNVVDSETYMAEERARQKLLTKILSILREKP